MSSFLRIVPRSIMLPSQDRELDEALAGNVDGLCQELDHRLAVFSAIRKSLQIDWYLRETRGQLVAPVEYHLVNDVGVEGTSQQQSTKSA